MILLSIPTMPFNPIAKDTIMLNSTNNHKFIESHLKSLVDLVPNHAHIQLDACNDFILPSNWDFKNRTNSNYHLAYVKSGSGSYTVDGEEIHMTPGRIYLFSKQCLHSRRLDQKDLPRIALLRFSILDNKKNNMPFSHSFDGHALSYVTGKTKVLLPLLNTLFSYYMDESDAYKPLCQILLSQLLHEMNLDIKDSNTSSRIDPRLTRAHSYITKQFKTSISLDHLVKLSSLSRNYFLKMFKECYGTSPSNFKYNCG